jgi:hypothetical protein
MDAILSPLGLYGGNQNTKIPLLITRDTCPSRMNLEVFVFAPSDGCPATANLLSLNASLVIPTRVLHFDDFRLHHRTLVRPVRCCCTSVFDSSVLALWINQGTQWFSGRPPETPRTRCSLRQSPLMTWLPRSPGSTLVLRLSPKNVHDFILHFLTPCNPHLTSLATRSLERSLLVFSTPGGLTSNDLSRLFFTCTNTSQATTFTCNTSPRISPHYVLSHSSH